MPSTPPLIRIARRLILAGVLLSSSLAGAQGLPLPVLQSGVTLDAITPEATFTIDAGTLPARSRMVTTATPDALHADMEFEIEIECTWRTLGFSPCAGTQNPPPFYTQSAIFLPGEASLDANFAGCNYLSPFPGETCDVTVTAVDFGGGGSPADIDVEIRGYTEVPFGTEFVAAESAPQLQSIDLTPAADTTIYRRYPTRSNGEGESLWTGLDYSLGFPLFTRDPVRPLLQFDLDEPAAPTPGKIPPGATISDASLQVTVIDQLTGSFPLAVHAVTDRDGNSGTVDRWLEGNADASGNEFAGAVSILSTATWDARNSPNDLWNTPGAGFGPELASAPAPTVGDDVTFSSPALTAEVVRQYDEGDDQLGFTVLLDGFVVPPNADLALRFASREYPTASARPTLTVQYTPEFADTVTDQAGTEALPFVAEGEDFRWIYDDDGDDVLLTDVGGRCVETAENEGGGLSFVPYEYTFEGDPTFQGLDCCTWRIESGATGVVGAGQAIFFMNLDPNDPANHPQDFDGDGIRDLCDNCRYTPNGPLLGTCVSPTGPYSDPSTQSCRSDLECAAGDVCHLSQEVSGVCQGGTQAGQPCEISTDCPGSLFCDFTDPMTGAASQGVACPEPGFVPMLAVSFGVLLAWGRRANHGQACSRVDREEGR